MRRQWRYRKGFRWHWFQWAPAFSPEALPAGLLRSQARLDCQRWAWEPELPRPRSPQRRRASSIVCCPSPLGPSLNMQKDRQSISITAAVFLHDTQSQELSLKWASLNSDHRKPDLSHPGSASAPGMCPCSSGTGWPSRSLTLWAGIHVSGTVLKSSSTFHVKPATDNKKNG